MSGGSIYVYIHNNISNMWSSSIMVTIGSDVEVAVHNNGIPVDVTGLIGGSKHNPVWFKNFNLQEDNVNAEYAINPVNDVQDWLDYHNQAITKIECVLPDGYGILYSAATEYDSSQLLSENSRTFGCDPDKNIWSNMPINTISLNKAGNMRTCGGHIHVGIDDNVNKEQLIKWMDILLGLPSLFLDTDDKRRNLYGKAGSYRDKPYGIEYRSLSNFWIKDDESIKWAYYQTMKAVDYSMLNILNTIPNISNVPRCINRYDKHTAETTLNWLTKEGFV